MTVGTWLEGDLEEVATNRILDAAGVVFAERGGAKVNMGEIAAAAGCSRATLYRYFDSRDALQAAFVRREARRVGARVAEEVASIGDPRVATTERILAAVRHVRSQPLLHAWFSSEHFAAGPSVARASTIEAMVAASLGDPTDADTARRARWVVRAIVSLLTMPGSSADEERMLVEQFVVPVVVA